MTRASIGGDRLLADRSWPDITKRPTVLVPVGSLEQHGPHLPLDTDTVVAQSAAAAAAGMLENRGFCVLVAPPIAYGASGEHQSFPGTVSIGHDALRLLVIELTRSLSTWAGRVVLINGHGGNVATLRSVVPQMRGEGHDLVWVPCLFGPHGDAHAGRDETSVMLHLAPDRVRMDRASVGNTRPLEELMPVLVSGGLVAVTEIGVLGDSTSATPERGESLFEALSLSVAAAVEKGEISRTGRLVVVTARA